MSGRNYDSLTTPQLHADNERRRRKWNRADAATRNADPYGATFTETGTDGPREYWEGKRDNRAKLYLETQRALKKRGENETEYTTAQSLKDSFIGSYKPLHKPVGKSICVVM